MKYKLKDLQGAGLKEDYIFADKHEIIDNLTYFHSQDWTGEKDLNSLLRDMENDEARLAFLCDYGQWEVYEIEDYEEVLQLIDDMDNDDEELAKLQNAMEFFCGTWDICEGYKHALRLTIKDQYHNHADEQDPEDLEKLKAILK